LYLLSHRYYRGAESYRGPLRWIWLRLEILGKESFMFLILHWLLISTFFLAVHLGERFTGYTLDLNPYLRAALIVAGTALLIPPLARWRDRLAGRPHFATKALLFLGGSLFAALIFGMVTRDKEIGLYVTYGASMAFAFVYPTLRIKLRRRYTTVVAG